MSRQTGGPGGGPPFRDRRHAGAQLSTALTRFRGRDDLVVLGLPRGGVPVAYEVANALRAPLDVFVVRKLGVPGHEELAMGAIASGGVRVLVDPVIGELCLRPEDVEAVSERERRELARRESAYRGERAAVEVRGRTVLVVDDGLATGASMRAAVVALRTISPRVVVVAVPTAPADTVRALAEQVDSVVSVITPDPFLGVGHSYADFSQTTDAEVTRLLALATERGAGEGPAAADRQAPDQPA
jgi:predicted phosphoribosyltransferase